MEDRFKFRYFNKGSKRMYYGQGFHIQKLQNDPVNIIFWDNEEHSHLQWKPDVIVMQCTGLKDKNGKLIYEGDIVTFEKSEKTGKLRKGIVKYYLNYCWFFVEVEENQWARPFNTIPDRPILEVIGNIYENAELLKEGK